MRIEARAGPPAGVDVMSPRACAPGAAAPERCAVHQRMHSIPPMPEPPSPPSPPPAPRPDVPPPDVHDPPAPEHPSPIREPRTPPPEVARA